MIPMFELESHCLLSGQQVKLWFSVEGEKQLAPLDSETLSLTSVKEMRQSLDNFLAESVVNARFMGYIL